jgi:hypothetical protein
VRIPPLKIISMAKCTDPGATSGYGTLDLAAQSLTCNGRCGIGLECCLGLLGWRESDNRPYMHRHRYRGLH